ncbi:MAG: hypothetical protein LBS74_00375 [Oscillospiraceae bacterium]|jgi:drug/metabolite transporter (DMT)-like permease|nr:hypothetical protein [Oscillospiraceae bacterium]
MQSTVNYRAHIKFSWIAILVLQVIMTLGTVIHIIAEDIDDITAIDYLPADLLSGLFSGILDASPLGDFLCIASSAAFVVLNALAIKKRKVGLPIISLCLCGLLWVLLIVVVIIIRGPTDFYAEDFWIFCAILWPYIALFTVTLIGVINILKEHEFLKSVNQLGVPQKP